MLSFSFKNHNIPDVSLSTVDRNEIFYINAGILSVYSIYKASSTTIGKCKSPSNIFIFKQDLYVVDGNILMKYKQNELYSSIKLLGYSLKSKIFEDGIVIIYSNCIQIYDGSLFTIKSDITESFIDICFDKEECFLLTSQNIYKMKNIFY